MSNTIYTFIKNGDKAEYILTEERDGKKFSTCYVEMRTPNRSKLKMLLEAAKGPARTFSQFARDCSDKNICPANTKKINTPTFARIMSENDVVRPLKAEVIQAILNNAADKRRVSPDVLLHANGLELKQIADKIQGAEASLKDTSAFVVLKARAAADIRRCLRNSGGKKWIDSSVFFFGTDKPGLNTNRFKASDRYGYLTPYGFNSVFIEANSKKTPYSWGFYIDDTDPSQKAVKARTVNSHYEIFLDDIIHPEYMNDLRVSFVYQNKEMYNLAVSELSDVKVNNYFSVVLIREADVVAEYTVQRKDGTRPECQLGRFCDYYEGSEVILDSRVDESGRIETLMIPIFGY